MRMYSVHTVTTENALKAEHDDVIAWTTHTLADFLTTNSEYFSVHVCECMLTFGTYLQSLQISNLLQKRTDIQYMCVLKGQVA